MQDVRTISIDGGSDSGSGLARYELRFAGHVHTFPPGDASSFVFRRGLAGTANVTALDNAGNRSDPAHVTVSRNGPVRVVR